MAVWSEIAISRTRFDKRLDPQFYQPQYLENEKLLNEKNSKPLIALCSDVRCGPFGSAITVDDYRDIGTPFIRVSDTSDIFLKTDDLAFLNQRRAISFTRYEVEPDDIVVSQRGTVAQFSIVPDDYEKWIISANLISVQTSKNIDPYYLIAFLNSAIGTYQLERLQSGQVQPKIITDDIKHLLIYLPNKELEKKVSATIKSSKGRQEKAKELYAQAEHLLLSELGLDDPDLSPALFYERHFSETQQAARFDAEFFQPKYYALRERLNKSTSLREGSTIGSISKPLKYGTSAKLSYVEDGIPFLRIADLENKRFDEASVLRISHEEASLQKNARVSTGDVLISRSGTLGLAVAIPDHLANSVFGSYFIRVKPDCTVIHPEFLALYINALCGALQVERLNTGGIQTNLTIPAIESIFVVHGDMHWQMRFVEIVMKSVVARDESRRLLEEAKRMVEDAVLGRAV